MDLTPPSDDLFLHSLDSLTPSATTFAPEPPKAVEKAAAASETPVAEAAPAPVTDAKLRIAVKALKAMEQTLQNVIRLLEEDGVAIPSALQTQTAAMAAAPARFEEDATRAEDGRVLEGIFDGQNMVGSDGKSYPVPPNYASKSKLVEGDLLKLTITPRGTFIYKQIGPIDRDRVVGELGFDTSTGEYYAAEGTRKWNVLKASVTYFKGESGDDIVLLIPKVAPSKWAAVENIIRKDVTA
jgi:hypothetical protein